MKKNLCITLVVMFGIAACESQDQDRLQQQQQLEAVAAGESIFTEHCSECHERKGRGDYLKNIPVDMLTRRSEVELTAWIRGSNNHREMPNFMEFGDNEMRQLSLYLFSQIGK